ncbi:MAG: radical SAM family heme chaperone HemW [Bifidobacteriaceae bacterium]|jgi:oxygen-independent coproporphyrinogen-3 oxidase|nr:radical SAM family heme chaperone HemW [Bifidobacteriaceae bacterium]
MAAGPRPGPPAPFQVYLHVPYCARRCGYCDFNTYLAPAAERAGYADLAIAELGLAARALEASGWQARPAATVYFGGGTPSLLPAADLARLRRAVGRVFGLEPGAEVSLEANPDTVDGDYLERLAQAGFTRVSFGMQSAVPAVLEVLDRGHDQARVGLVARAAAAAGLAVSADLIYGAPGETLAQWEASVRAALDLGLRHVSAYALTLEPATPMARRIRAGQLGEVDEDLQADKYLLADSLFEAAGLNWYEISNWAAPGFESRHNMGYWLGSDWLGIGPGAHSAISGERFWNLKSPRAWGAAVAAGRPAAAGRERPGGAARELERVMLGLRTARGLAIDSLPGPAQAALPGLERDGLVHLRAGRLALTRRGRLLADLVTRDLMFI